MSEIVATCSESAPSEPLQSELRLMTESLSSPNDAVPSKLQHARSLRELIIEEQACSPNGPPKWLDDSCSGRTISTCSIITASTVSGGVGVVDVDDCVDYGVDYGVDYCGDDIVQRAVRFAEPECASVVGTVLNLADLSSEQRWNTWWCVQECQAMRLAAKYSTKLLRKEEPRATAAMQNALTSCLLAAADKSENNYFVNKALADPSAFPDAASVAAIFREWSVSSSKAICARGLEKYAPSSALKVLRAKHMSAARQTVVQLHRQQKQASASNVELDDKNNGIDAVGDRSMGTICDQDIADAYIYRTGYARLYARFIGLADRWAADQIYQEKGEESDSSSSCISPKSKPQTLKRTYSDDSISVTSLDSQRAAFFGTTHTRRAGQRRSRDSANQQESASSRTTSESTKDAAGNRGEGAALPLGDVNLPNEAAPPSVSDNKVAAARQLLGLEETPSKQTVSEQPNNDSPFLPSHRFLASKRSQPSHQEGVHQRPRLREAAPPTWLKRTDAFQISSLFHGPCSDGRLNPVKLLAALKNQVQQRQERASALNREDSDSEMFDIADSLDFVPASKNKGDEATSHDSKQPKPAQEQRQLSRSSSGKFPNSAGRSNGIQLRRAGFSLLRRKSLPNLNAAGDGKDSNGNVKKASDI